MPNLEMICKIGLDDGNADFLRQRLKVLAEAVMDVEVSHLVGAEHFERNTERHNYRNGYRPREWGTRVHTVKLNIPNIRNVSYFPSLLEPRKRAERALLNVVQEAYLHGVSTRKVDELVESLGWMESARARSHVSARSSTM
ncbi:transposase [Alicyclobacillus cycloheptanicus]|uniref:Mutator family transposase n=1 Tax=Alicyclobacillus cycloheptanicus TaxID=1457 RepID=A0ABT9XLJ5_9BACL|nr:transposase-like protein [Alicyclobacillus cycloheptanicus]WDM02026.1 transposase [Alicyclobacillus cycloheptanicus]